MELCVFPFIRGSVHFSFQNRARASKLNLTTRCSRPCKNVGVDSSSRFVHCVFRIMASSKTITVAACFIGIGSENKRVLLQKRLKKPLGWCLPGGAVGVTANSIQTKRSTKQLDASVSKSWVPVINRGHSFIYTSTIS